MKNMKKAYLAPMVEVMNARVEKGFAGSGNAGGNNGGYINPIFGQDIAATRSADVDFD